MSAVFRDVVITWQGKEYRIKPTMRLINTIEQQVSLSVTAQRMAQGQPPMSHIATIVGIMLRSAGCEVADEQIYLEISTGDSDLSGFVSAIFESAFPVPKKPEAPTSTEKSLL